MSSFCTHIFFSKKFQHICVSLDVNFNESLTNDIVSFEQLGPDIFLISPQKHNVVELMPRGTSNEYAQHMFLWRYKKKKLSDTLLIKNYKVENKSKDTYSP